MADEMLSHAIVMTDVVLEALDNAGSDLVSK
jgi:hypothetical protein